MLTETLLKNPFLEIGRCSLEPTSQLLQGKYARIYSLRRHVTAAPCMILQNHRRLPVNIFRVKIFKAGSWKDFQNSK
jgi:hypothetical protein